MLVRGRLLHHSSHSHVKTNFAAVSCRQIQGGVSIVYCKKQSNVGSNSHKLSAID